ncbi:Protein TASOR 2 [Galemys pyrenaicus]|uniref:Protein TASOR 2 n=1 Tax=Galemys pyrenaicus TaxID=202257 RepID=A0A8J6DQD9_GALPY|nr:Protein TASOR 2 [Galemys pyrenaicus]
MWKNLHNCVKSPEAAAARRTGKTSPEDQSAIPAIVDTLVCLRGLGIYDINREQDYVKNSGGILGENELRPPSQLHCLLEKTKTGFISEKIFETVSLSSDSLFQRAVSILRTAYLDSASEHGFQYSQVTLVKNDIFLNEYKTFYQEKKASNYTQEELQETYGFLLFETENQAKRVCQRGLCVGSSATTTLGDPAKGVYISKYSDYLHSRPWYHGKSGYVVIFNLIKGKVKFVPENYTTNYTSPSPGYDCHVAVNTNKVSLKTSHFRTFELSQYYLYELSGSTIKERPRQLCPYVIVTFQYKEPKKMAAPTHKSIPHELDFKYVMKVSSLKERLPEAAFKKQNYLEQKVLSQDICFNMYKVELSNKQGEKIDQLTEYIKNKQLAIIKCLEDRGFFILLTSSALISETTNGDEQMGLHGLHLFCSSLSTGMKDLKVEDDISLKVVPILPALNCALLEAKKSSTEEGICLNTLVRHNFQEFLKVEQSSLTASSQDGIKETTFFDKLSDGFDLVPPADKCPLQSLTQLKSYLSDPSSYILEVPPTLDLFAEHPQSPCISDGICDAGFSLVMTPDPEFLDSEAEVRKETEKEKNSEEIFKARQGMLVPESPASNLRVQPKRKASTLSTEQSKVVDLGFPFPKRTPAGADKSSDCLTTLKLVKGQFPQKRKRGAEVLTAQFVQTTILDRKKQDAPISKDVPVATNAKWAKKPEKSPVKTVSKAKPSVKKSPQKQRVNIVKGNQNPRIRKQPEPAKGETTSLLQSGISSSGQADVISINTAQPENTTVAQKDLPESSIPNCDSQALNMLADLALSSAPTTTSSSESKNLSELPQNDALLSKEQSLRGTSDHVYHRGVKSQKGGLLPKLSSDTKSDLMSDSTVSQEESVVSGSMAPTEAQPTLSEETLETSVTRLSSFVAVEHSYALLLAEHSKKQLQQKGVPGSTFAKNNIKGPEAGTPVGKVMPFRHQQCTSPLQKFSESPLLKRKTKLLSSNLKDFFCSHTVFSCDGSFKVTFKCETEYVFSLDSKYTNNALEKTVIRALHGPWNTDLPDNVEEVKLLLHMWVALFYSNQNKVIRSSRRVVEHSNPAKYVSINSTLESFEFSEIEESTSMQRCSADPLLETDVTLGACTTAVSFPEANTVLPLIKPPLASGLGLWIQNEQEEMFVGAEHPDTQESQSFFHSCNNEVIEGKAKQESSNKLETSSLVLTGIGSTEASIPSISSEGKTFKPLDKTTVTSDNETVTQNTVTKTYDGVSNESEICQNSMCSTLESEVDIFHAAVYKNSGALQEIIQHSSPMNKDCQPSLERKDDKTGYVTINLEPVTLTFEKNAYVPVQAEAGKRPEKPTAFNMELIKHMSPAASLQHPTQQIKGFRDISSQAVPGQQGTKYLCASSVSEEILAKETCSLQSIPGSSSSSNNPVVTEALSLVKSSNNLLSKEDKKRSQEGFLQTQSVLGISSEEIIEPLQVEEVVSSPAAATLAKNYSLNCIPSGSNESEGSSELKKDKSDVNSENLKSESFNSAFAKQTSQSANREEVSLELSEEDSDIDLSLTISPLTSSREIVRAGKIQEDQEAPLTNVEFQGMTKEIIEPEPAMCRKNREVNSASYTSVYPTLSKKPLENESKGDNSQPVTLIVPKESCTLEIMEEVHIPSDFTFASLIEEVSPPSSPDPQVLAEEIQPCQAMSLCSLKLPHTQCEKNDKFFQANSVDLATNEKENPFVSPTHPVGQENITQVQQMQVSAEMPLVLNNHSGGKDRQLTLSNKVTEKIIPSEYDENFSFSEKTPCSDTESNQAASATNYRDDIKPSLESRIRSGSPLQPISVENGNLNLKHLVLETSEFPFSPRKSLENKTYADTFVSVTTPGGIVNMSLKQQTSPKSSKKNLLSYDFKTSEGNYTQVMSLNSNSIDGINLSQAHMHSESSKQASSSDGTSLTHCTRPISGETGFQTQEISVVRMASLLKNSETEAELPEKSIDVGVGSQSNILSLKGEQKTIHVLQDKSTCETKGLLSDELFPMYTGSYQNTAIPYENTNEEPSFISKSGDPFVCGISKKQTENKMASEGHSASEDSRALDRDMDNSANSDIHYEPLSGDSDEDSFGDCRNPKYDMEDSCTSRCHTKKKGAYDAFLCLNNGDNEDWGYSNQVPVLETSIPPRSWYIGLRKEDKHVPHYIQIRDPHGIPRTYTNFTVTKEFQDTTRTLHSLRRHPSLTAKCGLLSSWTNTWQVTDDLTQNTLDLEYLRFAHKLKQIIKKGNSRHSSPSTNIFPKESPLQITAGAFPLTKIPESPHLLPVSRSRSPLIVTIMPSGTRQQSPHMRGHIHSSLDSSSFWKERSGHNRKHLTNFERNQSVSFHLNKLKYNSTLKESRNDISLILNEYAEFNKVMMNSNQAIFQDKETNVASGGATSQEMCTSFPQSASYEDMITDLCTSLHVKLKSVMKEACKSTFLFYLVETEDKSFFVRTKNILRKGGHTEIEPQHFCQAFKRENDTLIVIIRNEDISSHLHQIPSLLKLKHFPNVIFVGVDSPEDVLNYTYQELFQTGGFVVSDDKILETLTLVQLKEIIKILEKLNGNGRWKWLLHYRENKKLKEDVRVDPTAHKKNLILKSYQSANIIELLHYHQCDSRLSTKAEHLKCLLNLQIQHIHARFAVFLTEKLVSREAFENSGILVTNVNNFIEKIQKVAAPFRTNW